MAKKTKVTSTRGQKRSDKDVQKLAKRIKNLRLKAGFESYETFAFEKDLPRSQYGRYEQGEDIRFTSLIKVIKAFGLTPKEFFSEGFD